MYNPKYESNDYDILDEDKAPVKAAKVVGMAAHLAGMDTETVWFEK